MKKHAKRCLESLYRSNNYRRLNERYETEYEYGDMVIKNLKRIPTSNIRGYEDRWEFDVEGEVNKDDLIKFCHEHIRKMKYSASEYDRRWLEAKTFDEKMSVIAAGYYFLEKLEGNRWAYETFQEYID